MKLVFNLDGVICTPPAGVQFGIVEYVKNSKPIENAIEFMQWIRKKDNEIIIQRIGCSPEKDSDEKAISA